MKPIALIPARGGSKRCPGKNKRKLGGYPLWQWAAKQGELAGCTVVVSTDDHEIKVAALSAGYHPVSLVDAYYADDAPMVDMVAESLGRFRRMNPHLWSDMFVLLQPTSPFRSVETIRSALRMLSVAEKAVGAVHDPGAHFCWLEGQPQYDTARRPRTQELALCRETGGIYASRYKEFQSDNSFVDGVTVSIEQSQLEALDIDTEHDWWLAETILEKRPDLSPFDAKNVVLCEGERGRITVQFDLEDFLELEPECDVDDETGEVSDYEWLSQEYADLRRRLDEVTRERDALRREASGG